MNKLRAITAAVIALAAVVLLPSQAHAASFTWASQPLTNLKAEGVEIHGGFVGFPTKGGLYISQCAAPETGGARPTNCMNLLWVSANGEQGSISNKGDIKFTLKAKFNGKSGAVDCAVTGCGLFFQLAHPLTADTSEDTYLPITFAAATTTVATLAADSITVTLNGTPLTKNVPVKVGYRAKAILAATSTSGLPVTVTSSTTDCTVVNGVFTALKGSGFCAVDAATAGDSKFDAAKANYPFIIIPGSQALEITKLTIKRGATKALPATTNFGADVTYSSNTKGCKVELNIINAISGKSCVLKASAPAKSGMWDALKQTIQVTIK